MSPATTTAPPPRAANGVAYPGPVEPGLLRGHEHLLAVHLLEGGEDLVGRVAAVDERDHVLVHRRREAAGHRGAAGEHVERARARARDLVLERVARLHVHRRARAGLAGRRTGRYPSPCMVAPGVSGAVTGAPVICDGVGDSTGSPVAASWAGRGGAPAEGCASARRRDRARRARRDEPDEVAPAERGARVDGRARCGRPHDAAPCARRTRSRSGAA
jgi:hypothetical protein